MAGSSGLSDVLREMAEGRRSRPRPESAEARREPPKDDVPRQKPRHSPPPSAAQVPASPAASGPKPAPSKPRVEATKPPTKPVKPPVAKAPPPPPPARVVEDDEEVLIAEVDEPVAPVAARRASSQAAPAPTRIAPGIPGTPSTSGRRRAPAAPAQTSTLKEIGACLFTTISLLMLVVAIWGTLVLMDFEIWRYDQPGAQTMAKMSQVFYLLAIVGLAYSVWLFMQIAAEKKKAANNRKKR